MRPLRTRSPTWCTRCSPTTSSSASSKARPELLPDSGEEMLRFMVFGSALDPRIATADVKLGEVVARAGEPVLYSRSSANRDERVFPRAGELDITRDPNPTRRLRLRAPPLPGRRAGADGAPGGARHHLVPAPYRSTRERADLASRDHDTRPGRVSGHLLKAPPATARAAVPQQPASDSACVALPVSPPAYSARAMV